MIWQKVFISLVNYFHALLFIVKEFLISSNILLQKSYDDVRGELLLDAINLFLKTEKRG